jgi:hypothetical protein
VATEDVLLEDLRVERLALWVVSGEALVGVGDEDAAVTGTLHGTEDPRTGRGAPQPNIKEGFERAGCVLFVEDLRHGQGTVRLGHTLVLVGKTEFCEGPTGTEQARCVCCGQDQHGWEAAATEKRTCSPVGEPVLDAVAGQLAGMSRDENEVTLEAGVHDLADDVLVGEADNQTVLGRVAG